MRKALLIPLVPLLGAAFVTPLFAQSSTGKPAAGATSKAHVTVPQKKAVVERKTPEVRAPKGKMHRYTGNVTKVDTRMQTIVIKGKTDEMTFDIGKAQVKGDVKEGDRVTVKYVKKDGFLLASSVVKSGTEKEKRKQMQPGAKPVKQASGNK